MAVIRHNTDKLDELSDDLQDSESIDDAEEVMFDIEVMVEELSDSTSQAKRKVNDTLRAVNDYLARATR